MRWVRGNTASLTSNYTTLLRRRKFHCGVKKKFVVSGPDSGLIRLITLAPSAIERAQIVGWITQWQMTRGQQMREMLECTLW